MEFIFDLLSRKVYNQGNQKINNKMYKYFVKSISSYVDIKTIGFDWLWDYTVYQFEYWYSKNTRQNKIHSSWFFGEKAIKRWVNKNPSWMHFNQKFLNVLDIQKPVNFYSACMSKKWEEVRAKDFGTLQGFLNCQLDSTFDKDSKYCKVCEYAEICEESL